MASEEMPNTSTGRRTIGKVGLLLPLLLASACREDRVLSADEARQLFSGKTVAGYHEKKGYRFESYYGADGTFRSYQGSERTLHPGRWWTTPSGDFCVRWKHEGKDLCRKIVTDDKGHYWKLLIKRRRRGGLKRILVVSYISFVEGNPKKL